MHTLVRRCDLRSVFLGLGEDTQVLIHRDSLRGFIGVKIFINLSTK